MRFIGFLLVSLMMLACSSTYHESDVEFYQRQILKSTFVTDTLSNQDAWFEFLSKVSDGLNSGDERWLHVVGEFRKEADAGASESLNITLSKSLPYRADLVLAATDYGFDLDRLCKVPFIEPDQETVKEFKALASAELERLVVRGDSRARDCLTKLE